MTEQEFETLLAIGHEQNGVEFKGRGNRTDRSFLAGVTRAILGMAYRRDGGFVILGVDADSMEPVGFEDDEVKTWLNYDELAARVNEFASPSVSFDLESLSSRERRVIIIHVHEFGDIPILCRRDFQAKGRREMVLRRGACYVRSRHKPETSEIPSEEEMPELLELAIDKGVRKFLTRAHRAGLFPSAPGAVTPVPDEALFEKQIEDME